MTLTVLDQIGAFSHAVAEFVRSAPTNVWAMCAFAAAASIVVTLVTLLIWPAETTSRIPAREPVTASGVRVMATNGVAPADIARRTGLSHDAVATILRASALSRGDRTVPRRKSRPTSA